MKSHIVIFALLSLVGPPGLAQMWRLRLPVGDYYFKRDLRASRLTKEEGDSVGPRGSDVFDITFTDKKSNQKQIIGRKVSNVHFEFSEYNALRPWGDFGRSPQSDFIRFIHPGNGMFYYVLLNHTTNLREFHIVTMNDVTFELTERIIQIAPYLPFTFKQNERGPVSLEYLKTDGDLRLMVFNTNSQVEATLPHLLGKIEIALRDIFAPDWKELPPYQPVQVERIMRNAPGSASGNNCAGSM